MFIQGELMKITKRETANILAKAHFEIEPFLKKIFLLEPINEQEPDEPIKLLEIVDGTLERGLEPISFSSDPERGINYPSIIIEISPKEYQNVCEGKLNLNDRGWKIGYELTNNYGNY